MDNVHIFATGILMRRDTGDRKECYCWKCRRRTTRAYIATYPDHPYLAPSGEWVCLECKLNTYFGSGYFGMKPIEFEPEGTEVPVPEWWFD